MCDLNDYVFLIWWSSLSLITHMSLTEYFAEFCVVKVRVFQREPLSLIFRPNHERVHRPADARLALSARGSLALRFGVRERVKRVHLRPRALSRAGHHDWARASGQARVVTGVTRIGTARLLHAARALLRGSPVMNWTLWPGNFLHWMSSASFPVLSAYSISSELRSAHRFKLHQ